MPSRLAPAPARTGDGLDFSELLSHPPRRDVRGFARHVLKTDRGSVVPLRKRIASAMALVVTALLAAGLVLFVSFIGDIVATPGSLGDDPGATDQSGPTLGGIAVVALLGAIAIMALVWMWQAVRRDIRLSNRWRRRLRLVRFAESNGGAFVPEMLKPQLPGTIFRLGVYRRAFDVVDLRRSRGLTMGSLSATGKDLFGTRRWAFAIMRLETRMPHLVLEARRPRRNLSRRLFGWTFRGSQRLSLEGDFDRHFSLFVPAGYGSDALYVFTPDLMALLVDRAHGFDVEIVDDALVLSRPGALRPDDAVSLAGLVDVVDALRDKARRQTHRYADARAGAVPHVLVAPGGRRLVRTRTLAVAIGFVLLGLRIVDFVHQLAH